MTKQLLSKQNVFIENACMAYKLLVTKYGETVLFSNHYLFTANVRMWTYQLKSLINMVKVTIFKAYLFPDIFIDLRRNPQKLELILLIFRI